MNHDALRLLFFEEADVLFSIYDKDLNCIDVNKATLRMFNAERDQIIGKNIRDLNPDAVSSGRYAAYQQVIKTGETHVINEMKAWPDKKEVYFRIKVFKLGEGIGIVSKNITDLENIILNTVSELRAKIKNLDEANASITEMLNVVSNQNTQLNDFCGIISHNLRSPLVNLSILSDYITECQDPVKREVMFSKIKPVVNTLNETFNILVESLQVREEVGVTCEVINLEVATRKAIEKHQIEFEVYHAELVSDFSAAENIYYPKKYLDSILSNLISNALKYRSELRTPVIRVKTVMVDGVIQLRFTDNGLGIDLKKHGHHIFKMRKVFHNRPDAKGYGLFMTKTQVEAMHGQLSVESTPGEGTTFIIQFNQKNNVEWTG